MFKRLVVASICHMFSKAAIPLNPERIETAIKKLYSLVVSDSICNSNASFGLYFVPAEIDALHMIIDN